MITQKLRIHQNLFNNYKSYKNIDTDLLINKKDYKYIVYKAYKTGYYKNILEEKIFLSYYDYKKELNHINLYGIPSIRFLKLIEKHIITSNNILYKNLNKKFLELNFNMCINKIQNQNIDNKNNYYLYSNNLKNIKYDITNYKNYDIHLKQDYLMFEQDLNDYDIINKKVIYKDISIFQILKRLYKLHKISKIEYKGTIKTIKIINYNNKIKPIIIKAIKGHKQYVYNFIPIIEKLLISPLKYLKIKNKVTQYINMYYLKTIKSNTNKNTITKLKQNNNNKTFLFLHKHNSRYKIKIKQELRLNNNFTFKEYLKIEFNKKFKINNSIENLIKQ